MNSQQNQSNMYVYVSNPYKQRDGEIRKWILEAKLEKEQNKSKETKNAS